MAAAEIDMQNYTLPKLKGTRFVGHHIKAYKACLDIWPALVLGLETVEGNPKIIPSVKTNVKGLLESFVFMTFCAKHAAI